MRRVALWLALCLGCSNPGAPIPFGETQDGIATWYDATGDGACSFGRSSDLQVAAMNAPQFAGSAVCGECIDVKGPRGSTVVRVVDKCPECGPGHLDLSKEAFSKIAELSQGKVDITWQPVACPVSGNVQYHFKDGSSKWWTAIQVRNHRLPISKLEWSRQGSWVEISRESYNYFVVSGGVGDGPVKVRVTAVDGQTLEDTLPPAASDLTANGAGQFR